MKHLLMLLGLVAVLVAAAVFLPSNNITGRVVQERSCGEFGCSELCEQDAPNTCGGGKVCCQTHWESGICDYSSNCEQIREYSLYQSLESFQDSVRERPAQVQADWRSFFLPLLLTLGVVVYFIARRKNP